MICQKMHHTYRIIERNWAYPESNLVFQGILNVKIY